MKIISLAILVAFASLGAPAFAQMDHSMHGTAMANHASAEDKSAMGDALVKKIDKIKATVTLQHGALPNGMPPMTMAYKVKDVAALEKLKVGQKIRFATDPADGGMTVTKIELVK